MRGEAEYDEIVMSLVEAALSRPPEERESFLQSTCPSDPELYEEVRSRIEWEERMGGFLREPVVRRRDGSFAPGQLLAGRFRILREAGRGGMGVVCEAFDERLNRRVAIKSAQQGLQASLSPEARAALEVSHPNVCKIHEIHSAETPDGPVEFLTMEFIDGETAASRLRREGPLPPGQVKEIALQLCAGLGQAHRQGVTHGDLKTANIILGRSQEGALRAVITDFGLARLAAPAAKDASAHGGTPGYMAPELERGAAPGVASDIYALGVLFHVLLTGSAPGVTGPDALPRPWRRIVARCLRYDPEQRFASAEKVAQALLARRAIARWLLVAAMVIISALGAALWVTTEPSGPPVRLAVLPFSLDGAADPGSLDDVGADVADRLSGLRRRFDVISPSKARQFGIDTPDKAKSSLGATHVLRTQFRKSGDRIAAFAVLTDTASGQTLRDLKGDYGASDGALLAKALTGLVTRTFGLSAETLRESVSPGAYPYYAQGVALLQRDTQSSAEAIPFLNKAIELDPRSALPWARLAQAQVREFLRTRGPDLLSAAAGSAARARSINPDSVPVLLASAACLQMQGQYEQAIAEFTRATQLEPANAEGWRALAFAYEITGRNAEAVAAYRKAIDAQPADHTNYMDFGGYYLNRNEYAPAEDLYRKSVATGPGVAGAHMNLGLALMMQGKYPEAGQSLMKALQLRRTAALLMNIGTLHFKQEQYREAVHWWEQALAAGPPTARRYRSLGDGHRALGNASEARQAYAAGRAIAEDDVARNPRHGVIRAELAFMLAHLGETRRAEIEISQALALEPENALVMRDAVLLWEVLGRRDRALDVLRHAPPDLVQELSQHPDTKALREDPGFRDILALSKSGA